jgi:hypothetical protein
MVFALDDAAEAIEQQGINLGIASMFEALTNAMGMLNNAEGVLRDVVASASQVTHDTASRLSSLWFFVFLTCVSL